MIRCVIPTETASEECQPSRCPRPHPPQPPPQLPPPRRRGLEVVDELSREIFRILVGGERVMYFLTAPEGQTSPAPHPPDAAPSDVPAELLALPPSPPPTPTAPPHATPTTSSRPRSPSPASTCGSARPSGRRGCRSRSRGSTSSTSRARNFLWRLDHETVDVRRRDGDIPPSLRKPDTIVPEEVGAALVHAV